jgi:hypothetical protein
MTESQPCRDSPVPNSGDKLQYNPEALAKQEEEVLTEVPFDKAIIIKEST